MTTAVGRAARTNAFKVIVRVMMDDDDDTELLALGAQEILRIFCTPIAVG